MSALCDAREIATHLEENALVLLQFVLDEGHESRIRSKFIRWKPGEFLIVSVPVRAVREILGCRRVVGRFVVQQAVCGFESRLVQIIADAGLARLAWPETLQVQRMREHQRVGLDAPCQLAPPVGPPHTGRLRDLSLGGCGLSIQTGSPLFETCTLVFELGELGSLEGLRCVVRSRRENNGVTVLGCEFQEPSTEVRELLQHFVTACLVQERSAAIAGID